MIRKMAELGFFYLFFKLKLSFLTRFLSFLNDELVDQLIAG